MYGVLKSCMEWYFRKTELPVVSTVCISDGITIKKNTYHICLRKLAAPLTKKKP